MRNRVLCFISTVTILSIFSQALFSETAFLLPASAQKPATPQGKPKLDPVKSWQLFLVAGQECLRKGDMAKALHYFKLSEVCAREIPGRDGIDKLDVSLKLIASLYSETKHYAEAAQYGRQVVELSKASHQPYDEITTNLNALAKMLKRAGKYTESEQAYKEALVALGPKLQSSQDAATIHDNLGLVYQEEKQYDKAATEHQLAYGIYHKLVGDDNKDTAYCQMNLAEACVGLKDYTKAEPLLNSARATLERTEGASSVAMANLLDCLGILYSRTNRLAEAEEMQKRAIVLVEKYHGHFSADTAISLSNLASTYSLENKDADAKRTSLEACAVATKALGASHPLTKRCATVLAAILDKETKSNSQSEAQAKSETQPNPSP